MRENGFESGLLQERSPPFASPHKLPLSPLVPVRFPFTLRRRKCRRLLARPRTRWECSPIAASKCSAGDSLISSTRVEERTEAVRSGAAPSRQVATGGIRGGQFSAPLLTRAACGPA